MCVISDKSGALGLGGIIGGTTDYRIRYKKLLEAAFRPSSIRKTARVLNINTDAKYRFEEELTLIRLKRV